MNHVANEIYAQKLVQKVSVVNQYGIFGVKNFCHEHSAGILMLKIKAQSGPKERPLIFGKGIKVFSFQTGYFTDSVINFKTRAVGLHF
jgi:hypothetical protein